MTTRSENGYNLAVIERLIDEASVDLAAAEMTLDVLNADDDAFADAAAVAAFDARVTAAENRVVEAAAYLADLKAESDRCR